MKKLTTSFASALITLAAFTACFVSCSKKSDDATQFAGTFSMSSTCYATNPQAVVISTNGNSAIYLPVQLGSGVCEKVATFSANVSGSNILSTTYSGTDACGNAETIVASGTINGSSLTLYYTFSNSSGSTSCTFTGSK